MSDGDFGATVLWRRMDVPGMEHFVLKSEGDARCLAGTVFATEDGVLSRLDYSIECSAEWIANSLSATFDHEGVQRELRLTRDTDSWRDGDREITSVKGLVDVDLSLTPATNILPMLRLGLRNCAVGESLESAAAWVLFPQMTVQPLRQRYTKVAERRFFYENLDDPFTTEIEIDDSGLVVSYPPFWEASRSSNPTDS